MNPVTKWVQQACGCEYEMELQMSRVAGGWATTGNEKLCDDHWLRNSYIKWLTLAPAARKAFESTAPAEVLHFIKERRKKAA